MEVIIKKQEELEAFFGMLTEDERTNLSNSREHIMQLELENDMLQKNKAQSDRGLDLYITRCKNLENDVYQADLKIDRLNSVNTLLKAAIVLLVVASLLILAIR